MKIEDNLYGLVVCGGQSTRMVSDKGFLVYYEKPQCYHLADMLTSGSFPLCSKVFLSCNKVQADSIAQDYNILTDLPQYQNQGPIASLLTAFSAHPASDFLVVGCDYPFIKTDDLRQFLESIQENPLAAAFYNQDNKYEPLLAWYSGRVAPLLFDFYEAGGRSLQQFLRENAADKYQPKNEKVMISVDTPEAFAEAKAIITNQKLSV